MDSFFMLTEVGWVLGESPSQRGSVPLLCLRRESHLHQGGREAKGSCEMMLRLIDCHGLSDAGCVRKVNDAQFLIADLNKSLRVYQTSLGRDEQAKLFGGSQGKLLLVVDHAGDAVKGSPPSSTAVDSVVHYILNHMRWFFCVDETAEDDLLADLVSVLKHCQAAICTELSNWPTGADTGIRITLAYLIWPELYLVHVGDGCCYLWRNGQLSQLIKESPNRVRDNEGASGMRCRPEGQRVELALGDTLLLCTDGLTRHVSDTQIASLLESGGGSQEICHLLIDVARAQGSRDNITMVAVQCQGLDAAREKREAAERRRPSLYGRRLSS